MNATTNIPIYWINMPKRADRRNNMQAHFKELNITNHTRITPPQDLKPTHSCIMAHYRAIQTAYYDKVDFAMIVEDDLNLTSSCLEKVHEALTKLPDDWDCMQVHYIEPNLIGVLVGSTYDNAVIKGYLMGCTCYVFNKKGINKFMGIMGVDEPTFTVTDDAKAEEFVFRYVNSYFMLHPVVNTLETDSDIRSDRSVNVSNADITDTFLNLESDTKWSSQVINFPYHTHWFADTGMAKHALETSFGLKKSLYVYLHSGFGNRLFQYYSAYGLAKSKGLDFRVLGQADCHHKVTYYRDKYKLYQTEDVNLLLDQFYTEHFIIKDKNIQYNESGMSEYEFIDIDFNVPGKSSYVLNGFFQNEKYFIEYRDEISKELLSGVKSMMDKNNIGWDESEKELANTVVIHIRLGDIVAFQKHYVDLGDYYERCITQLIKTDPNLKFVLVCEEAVGIIERFYPKLTRFPAVEPGGELYDFYLMANCRGVICANSTFSWWAAWVNSSKDKLVCLPNKWLNDRSDMLVMDGALVVDV